MRDRSNDPSHHERTLLGAESDLHESLRFLLMKIIPAPIKLLIKCLESIKEMLLLSLVNACNCLEENKQQH